MNARTPRLRAVAAVVLCLAATGSIASSSHASGSITSTLRAGDSVSERGVTLLSPSEQFSVSVAGTEQSVTAISTPEGQCTDYLYGDGDGSYETLVMQADGNLVQYREDGSVGFASGTHGNRGAYAKLHNDGALRVHAASGKVLWSMGEACSMVMGTQRPYEFEPTFDLKPGWQLNSPTRRYTLSMQQDGNLVLRNASGKTTWQSGTSGNRGAHAVAQTDGNVVVYSRSGRPLWQTRTAGMAKGADARLVVQNDGNVVLYEQKAGGATRVMWSTGTAGR